MTNQTAAQRLTSALALDPAPVALTFTDAPPEGVAGPAHAVTSACAFWRMAEQGVFYAPAEAHDNCPIGAMVMGFPLTEPLKAQLGELVTSMCDCTYLSPEEGDKIPGIEASAAGILYGPLADLPTAPQVVLFWLTPRQAMLYNEAAGTANWANTNILSTGRPACAALPSAISSGSPTISWGCIGMRTFTDIPDDRLLAAVPGARLDAFLDDLERTVAANQTMKTFYEGKKAALTA
ncbi:hypothetical protein AA958_19140 [Streptomyces sp. CNQ-509]|uniref:DUF169 domain-containing protein n=1 Tax=Streptomyces sp. CNQ-509 TaxID=444103 RepID=UPI00062DD00B|nr:DUF169 domain-containing protein [Streptomyces sp. CNQ-509]AKH83953.1 hypothetical protein AA958_19140 [Streptomyces sp. CNQ-509]